MDGSVLEAYSFRPCARKNRNGEKQYGSRSNGIVVCQSGERVTNRHFYHAHAEGEVQEVPSHFRTVINHQKLQS